MVLNVKKLVSILITLSLVGLAIFLGNKLWVRYMDTPWTRDGRVRADIVNIASDVSGIVSNVDVVDNQYVRKGDILFVVDNERYKDSLSQADAVAEQKKLNMEMKKDQAARRAKLDDQVISRENREDASVSASAAAAEYSEALALREHAKLNLSRTVVRSPVNGWVTNLLVRPGDFAQNGVAKLAVIDQQSFWVYGYFEENKIPLIHVGDEAEVRLLGTNQVLKGKVESIAHGITDRDNPTDVRLLANVNPSFNWVRLAQRVPVRIMLDQVPSDTTLAAGMTCSVVVKQR